MMHSFSFCKEAESQEKETCLSRITKQIFPSRNDENENKSSSSSSSSDSEENRLKIGEYLKLCRSNTIQNEFSLQPLLRENHENVDKIRIDQSAANEATFWICDMIKSECLLMFITSKDTYLINKDLDVFIIIFNDKNNFSKICIDSSSNTDFTILQGSFMDKSAERKEFLIEDVIFYKSSSLLNLTLFERMQKISKTVGNYRQINNRKPSIYSFDFRGKPWIPNNSPKGCIDFFKWYRNSVSTGNIMFHDGRHPENFSLGYMIWSNKHIPFNNNLNIGMMFNWTYPPKFFVQIQLPIQARHQINNHHLNDGQGMGMRNKMGVIQDFNAMSNQSIQMYLRNEYDGFRTIPAIKAQFDEKSMKELIQISQTNTHNQWLLSQIIYNKQKSCYTLIDTLNESKITNLVEKHSKKYNQLLIKSGSSSSVHSASEKEKITLLTSSVTEFVNNCTQMIQTTTKDIIIQSFQSLSKPFIIKIQQKQQPQQQQQQQQQQRPPPSSSSSSYRQYIPEPPNASQY